jgi:hypothetical protein
MPSAACCQRLVHGAQGVIGRLQLGGAVLHLRLEAACLLAQRLRLPVVRGEVLRREENQVGVRQPETLEGQMRIQLLAPDAPQDQVAHRLRRRPHAPEDPV